MGNLALRKVEDLAQKSLKAWGKSYGLFSKIIREKKLKVGVEIGVAFGGHAEASLSTTPVRLLYGVDPYRHIRGYDDPMNLTQREFNQLYLYVRERLARFGSRYKHIRKLSKEAVGEVPDGIDFVYIDADHRYAGVWEDLGNWYPKVRAGGIIGGHDYGHANFPGVKQAVDHFFERFGLEINKEKEGVWWVEVKPLRVSYIIPAYNCEKTISAAVGSILNGNLREGDEIVIVDDASTDRTPEILKKLSSKHGFIRIIRHPFNRGGGAARNTAVANAKNKLIFCLDSDNVLAPKSVPKLVDLLVRSGEEIAAFQKLKYFKVTPKRISHTWSFRRGGYAAMDYLSSIRVPGASGNYLYTRRSWIKAGGYPEFAGALDTWGFGLRQVMSGQKMAVLPNSFYYHRIGHESYWVRESRKFNTSLRALQVLIPFLDRLESGDVNYVMGPKGRLAWFEKIDERPLKLKKEDEERRESSLQRVAGLLARIFRKL